MKKLVLFLSIVFAFMFVSWQTKAQQDTTILSNYDTVIIFHPSQLNGCIMNYDTNHIINSDKNYFNYYQESRYPILDSNGNWNNIFKLDGAVVGKNRCHPAAFAQPYHFDSTVYVYGVAAKVSGSILSIDSNGHGYVDTTYHFRLLDDKMNELTMSVASIFPLSSMHYYTPFNLYFFYNYYPVKDFYLVADEPTVGAFDEGSTLYFARTCSIYDTIWQDTIIGCQSNDSPLFKRNGQWIRFADDSVYNFYQKTFIEFLPILLLPHNTSGLNDIQLEDMCYVYPNPTNKELEIQSDYKVKDIIVFDMLGKKVIEKTLNNYETQLDVSSLKEGDYIIRLNTVKGIVNKKFIKQ
jgi:hypothetical protein